MINGIKIILYGTLHNKSATVKNIYSVIDIHMGLAPGPLQILKSRDQTHVSRIAGGFFTI